MSVRRGLVGWIGGSTAVATDLAVMAALVVGVAVQEAPVRQPIPGLLVALALPLTVGFRRSVPALAALVAIVGSGAVEALGGRSPVVLPVVVALNYYMVGRHSTRWAPMDAVVLVLPIPGIATDPGAGSPGDSIVIDVLSVWGFFMLAPFAAGRIVANRSALIAALGVRIRGQRQEQHARDRRAASEERRRIARELHDVVAHGVSVMVIQAAAARRVAVSDRQAALSALRAVESTGRDALSDLGRMVGVLDEEADDFLVGDGPGLAFLDSLAERARAVGLPVKVSVAGNERPLPPAMKLVLFRVVQESLTNVVKHAGAAQTQVGVTFTDKGVEIEIVDTGRGALLPRSLPDTGGQGLVGMKDRLERLGGQLHHGPDRHGGFEVKALIPLADEAPRPRFKLASREARGRWFDAGLAVVLLAVCETVTILDAADDHGHRHWSLSANVVIVAGMIVPLAWRRRAPLWSATVTMTCLGLLLVGGLRDVQDLTFPQVDLFIVPYSLAAYSRRTHAVAGLVISLAAVGTIMAAIASPMSAVVFVCGVVGGSWIVGRIIRARRVLATDLLRTSHQINTESEGRERLAIADQRSRISKDLDSILAASLKEMIAHAATAQRALDTDDKSADISMAAIERTGRQVLTQMRRLLGVLREPQTDPDLAPQPGLRQIPQLVEDTRRTGRTVTLTVEGEPGPFPPAVDLALYRIVEEVVVAAPPGPHQTVDVAIRFDPAEVELRATCREGQITWPLARIHERVSICGGQLHLEQFSHPDDCLVIRLPCISERAVV